MKLTKHGKRRNQGDALVFDGVFKKVECSTIAKKIDGKVILIADGGVDLRFEDKEGDLQHVYDMHLDASDIARILDNLSSEPVSQSIRDLVGAMVARSIK